MKDELKAAEAASSLDPGTRLRLRPLSGMPRPCSHVRLAPAPAVYCRYAEDLFTFGAVYFSALPPHPPPNLPEEVAAQYRRFIESFEEKRKSAKAMRRADPSGMPLVFPEELGSMIHQA